MAVYTTSIDPTINSVGSPWDNPVAVEDSGRLWMANGDTASWVGRFYYSDNMGVSWTQAASTITLSRQASADSGSLQYGQSMSIDSAGNAHAFFGHSYITGGFGYSALEWWVGTPNGNDWTWTYVATFPMAGFNESAPGNQTVAAVGFHFNGNHGAAVASSSAYPSLDVIKMDIDIKLRTSAFASVADYNNDSIYKEGVDYSGGRLDQITLDFNHTGDGKTVQSGAPHIYLGYSESSFQSIRRFHKLTYSGGTWSLGTARTIESTAGYFRSAFNGTDFFMALQTAASPYIKVYKRDAADTTTTNLNIPTPAGGGAFGITALDDGDIVVWRYLSGAFYKCLYENGSWGTWETVTTGLDTLVATTFRVAKHGKANAVVGAGFDTTPDEELFIYLEPLNNPPTAPTIDSPTNGNSADIDEALAIDWTFNDPDLPGDSQSAYSIRRRIGAGTYSYWNGTTWQESEDGSTKILTATSEASIPASWGTEAQDDHYYAVKTWDFEDEVSPWSAETRVVPSAQDNPTITDPVTDQVMFSTTYDVNWTVDTQTSYRLRTWPDSGGSPDTSGTPEYDSGKIASVSTRNGSVSFPTNSVTRHIEVQTWNVDSLASDRTFVKVTVGYTTPGIPTVSTSTVTEPSAVVVTIDNPAVVGDEPTPLYNDLHRRVVGDTGVGIRVAKNVVLDGTFTDWAVATGVAYEYRARVYADNTTDVYGAWTS